jgi:hypothetical protein
MTDYQFKAIEWKRLTAGDRAHRCRVMADEAITMANDAAPELKERYISIAEDFLRLAAELEARAKF